MPRVGESDLFENSYRKELDRRLDPYGVLIEYTGPVGVSCTGEPAVSATVGGNGPTDPSGFGLKYRTWFVDVPVRDRAALSRDEPVEGPAIIEQVDSTTIVPPGAVARVGEIGELVIGV